MVRGDELGYGPAHVRHRLDRVTSELGLDRERVQGWAVAQTLAWANEGTDEHPVFNSEHIEKARWLRDA